MRIAIILALEITLLSSPHAHASSFDLDSSGHLQAIDGNGTQLSNPFAPVLWNGDGPEHASASDDTVTCTFAGGAPVCVMTPLDPGRHGETRYAATLSNPGDTKLDGALIPGLADWVPEASDKTADHFALLPPNAIAGGIGPMLAWSTREFARDTFVTVPADTGKTAITASLLRLEGGGGRPNIVLNPGEEATFELHLDTLPGDWHDVLREIYRVRGGYRVDPASYDFSEYNNPQLAWANDLLAGWLNWAWDKDNMDPRTGEYRILQSLDEAKRKFGGYDVYMWWPFWPRAGFDARYQFDHYRDMPGGVDGLKSIIEQCRERGVRTILSHCIWSETDRDKSREGHLDSYRQLVEMALAVDADGVLMDIMSTTPPEIRQMVREHGKELLPYAEGDPGYVDSQTNLIGRIHNMHKMPAFNMKKYMLPHHPLLRVCEPGNVGKRLRKDFVLSFFNGHGIEINTMFPQADPDCEADWPILARALDILRTNRAAFRSTEWEPLVAGEDGAVRINRWPSDDVTLYTLCGTDPGGHHGPVIRMPHRDVRIIDLWNQRPAKVERDGEMDVVSVDIDAFTPGLAKGTADYSAGCLAVIDPLMEVALEFEMLRIDIPETEDGDSIEIWRDRIRPDSEPVTVDAVASQEIDLYRAFGEQTNEAIIVRLLDSNHQMQDMVVLPPEDIRFWRIDKPKRTAPVDTANPPEGMVRIPGGDFDYIVKPTAPTWQATYVSNQTYRTAEPSKPRTVTLTPFWMDRYPVTNAEYARFMEESGYRPENTQEFLAHWQNGKPLPGQENHPVVYVSYDDALAYAKWAGKRLPTEEEWQFAAGAADGRDWPWGPVWMDNHANNSHESTSPVDAYPDGASPYGVEDLIGNVWQMTASLTDNGRHLVLFLRGGSWYLPPEGTWWVKGGPRPITDHHPLPLMGPGMNRLATVGFRCVKDE